MLRALADAVGGFLHWASDALAAALSATPVDPLESLLPFVTTPAETALDLMARRVTGYLLGALAVTMALLPWSWSPLTMPIADFAARLGAVLMG